MQYRKIFDTPDPVQKEIRKKQGWMLAGLVLALLLLVFASPQANALEFTTKDAATATDPSHQHALVQDSFEGDEAATLLAGELLKKWFAKDAPMETLHLGRYGSVANLSSPPTYQLGLSGEAIAFTLSFSF